MGHCLPRGVQLALAICGQKNMRLFLIKWPGRAHCLFIIGVEVFINAHSRKGCSLKLAAERQITVTGVEPKPLPFQ